LRDLDIVEVVIKVLKQRLRNQTGTNLPAALLDCLDSLCLPCLDSHQHGTTATKDWKVCAVRIDHMNMGCPAEFICPITQEVMTDPVMVSETGQVRSGSRRTSAQHVVRA